MVRDWSNRDASVVSDTLIQQFLRFSADKCYRKLRVPSLEFTRLFTVEATDITASENLANPGYTEVTIPVPEELIDVIYIVNRSQYCVFNEKVDNRTYKDRLAEKKTMAYYTRVGDNFLVSGFVSVGDVIELHYYRRLPALNATYVVTAITYNADSSIFTRATTTTGDTTTNVDDITATVTNQTGTNILWFASADTGFATAFDTAQAIGDIGRTFVGNEAAHWLRDENERILIYGALLEMFLYLDENQDLEKYVNWFVSEIEELNQEEKMRKATGGSIQISYNGRGLI